MSPFCTVVFLLFIYLCTKNLPTVKFNINIIKNRSKQKLIEQVILSKYSCYLIKLPSRQTASRGLKANSGRTIVLEENH